VRDTSQNRSSGASHVTKVAMDNPGYQILFNEISTHTEYRKGHDIFMRCFMTN